MAFWSDVTMEPKRQFRFKVTFTGMGRDAVFLAQSADRPVYTISDGTTVHFLDKEFRFPGKITWTPIKIKFVDGSTQGTNASKNSYEYLKTAGWINPLDVGGTPSTTNLGSISKGSASFGTRDIIIETITPEGGLIDEWTLRNAFITTVSLSPLDYKSEDILTAEYTFRYDWADLK